MEIRLRVLKCMLFSMACELRSRAILYGGQHFEWLFDRALANAGRDGVVPGTWKFRTRARKYESIVRVYVDCLYWSLEHQIPRFEQKQIAETSKDHIHEELMKQMTACSKFQPFWQSYPIEIQHMVHEAYLIKSNAGVKYIADACEEFGFEPELQHLRTGYHQLGCPVLLNMDKKWFN